MVAQEAEILEQLNFNLNNFTLLESGMLFMLSTSYEPAAINFDHLGRICSLLAVVCYNIGLENIQASAQDLAKIIASLSFKLLTGNDIKHTDEIVPSPELCQLICASILSWAEKFK